MTDAAIAVMAPRIGTRAAYAEGAPGPARRTDPAAGAAPAGGRRSGTCCISAGSLTSRPAGVWAILGHLPGIGVHLITAPGQGRRHLVTPPNGAPDRDDRFRAAASGQTSRTHVTGRSWLASPGTPTALLVVVLLLAAAVIPLTVLARQNVLANAALLAISLPMGVVGLIVARRQPGNPIGWLLLVVLAGVLLPAWTPVGRMRGWCTGWVTGLPFGPAAMRWSSIPARRYLAIALPLVFLLFPGRRMPSPRWRWVLWST